MASQFGNTDSAVKKPTNRAFVQNQHKELRQEDSSGGGGFADLASGLGGFMQLADAGRRMFSGFKYGNDEAKQKRSLAFDSVYKNADPDDEQVWAPESVRQIADMEGIPHDQAYARAAAMKAQITEQKRIQGAHNDLEDALGEYDNTQEDGTQQTVEDGQELTEASGEGQAAEAPVEDEAMAATDEAMGIAGIFAPEQLEEITRSIALQAEADLTPNRVDIEKQVAELSTGYSPKATPDVAQQKAAVQRVRKGYEQSTRVMKMHKALIMNEVANGRTPSTEKLMNLALERENLYKNTGEALLDYHTGEMNIFGEYGDIIKRGDFTQDGVDYMRAMMDGQYKQELIEEGSWERIRNTPNVLPLQVWQKVQNSYGFLAKAQMESGFKRMDYDNTRLGHLNDRQKVITEAAVKREGHINDWNMAVMKNETDRYGHQVNSDKNRQEYLRTRADMHKFNLQYDLDVKGQVLETLVALDTAHMSHVTQRQDTFQALNTIATANQGNSEAKDLFQLFKLMINSTEATQAAGGLDSAAATQAAIDRTMNDGKPSAAVDNLKDVQKRRKYFLNAWKSFQKKVGAGEIMINVGGKEVPIDVSGGLHESYYALMKHMQRGPDGISVDENLRRKFMESGEALLGTMGFNSGGASVAKPEQWGMMMNRLREVNTEKPGFLPMMDSNTFHASMKELGVTNEDWQALWAVYNEQRNLEERYLYEEETAAFMGTVPQRP